MFPTSVKAGTQQIICFLVQYRMVFVALSILTTYLHRYFMNNDHVKPELIGIVVALSTVVDNCTIICIIQNV